MPTKSKKITQFESVVMNAEKIVSIISEMACKHLRGIHEAWHALADTDAWQVF